MILAGDLAAGAKLNEADVADAARRVARPRARGVSRARGIRPRPAGEEPRRLRAPDQRRGSRRDLRASRGARRIRRPPRSRRQRRRRRCASCARSSSAWSAPPRATTSTPTTAPTSISTTGWSSSPATPSCSPPTGASSTSSTCYRRATLAQAGTLPVSTREHRDDRRPDRRRPGRRRRARAVRARDGEPRAHAPRARAHRRASRAAAHRGNVAMKRRIRHRQRPHLPLARAAAGRRLRRRLRARLHQPGDRGRRARRSSRRCDGRGTCLTADCVVPSFTNPNNLSIVTGAPPSVHGICGNYFWDRDAGAEVMMNDAEVPARRHDPRRVRRRRRQGRGGHRQGQAARAARPPDDGHLLLGGEGRPGHARRRTASPTCSALAGMPVPSVYSAELSEFVFAAGVKLHGARAARPHVPVDHRLRPAQGRARHARRPTTSTR